MTKTFRNILLVTLILCGSCATVGSITNALPSGSVTIDASTATPSPTPAPVADSASATPTPQPFVSPVENEGMNQTSTYLSLVIGLITPFLVSFLKRVSGASGNTAYLITMGVSVALSVAVLFFTGELSSADFGSDLLKSVALILATATTAYKLIAGTIKTDDAAGGGGSSIGPAVWPPIQHG